MDTPPMHHHTLAPRLYTHLCNVSPEGPDEPPTAHARAQNSKAAGSSIGGFLSPPSTTGALLPTASVSWNGRLGGGDGSGGDASQARRRWSMTFHTLSVTSRTGFYFIFVLFFFTPKNVFQGGVTAKGDGVQIAVGVCVCVCFFIAFVRIIVTEPYRDYAPSATFNKPIKSKQSINQSINQSITQSNQPIKSNQINHIKSTNQPTNRTSQINILTNQPYKSINQSTNHVKHSINQL